MTFPVRWLIALALALMVHLGPLRPFASGAAARTNPAPRQAVAGRVVVVQPPPVMPQPDPPPPAMPSHRRQTRPAPQAAAAPTPFMAPPPTVLSYELRQGALALTMRFTWAPGRGRYRVALETPAATGRASTWLRSEGEIDPAGLLPGRHSVRPHGRSEQALTVVREAGHIEVAFSTVEQRLPAPNDVQDGLSWLPHWLGRWRATGRSFPLQVAHTDGRLTTLQLTNDPEDRWHWTSSPARPLDDTLELWLSPEHPHWPLRWRSTTPWGQTAEWRASGTEDSTERRTPPVP